MSETPKPLAGLKVVELGTLIAGPFCTRIMAEFGAEVVKVEAPDGGDPLRKWRKLYEGTSIQDIRSVVDEIIVETKKIGQSGRKTQEKLQEATDELESLKKEFEQDDELFKKEVSEYIDRLGEVVAVFENEPANSNILHARFPKAASFFVLTQHRGRRGQGAQDDCHYDCCPLHQ